MSDTPLRTLRSLVDISVDRLKKIGPKRTASLAEMGITSIFDLLTTYPRRYIDRTKQVDLTDVQLGEEVAIFGEVQSVRSGRTKQGRPLVSLAVHDGTATMGVSFFNQAWRAQQLPVGTQALFFGKVTDYRGRRQMSNPVVDVIVGASGDERDPSKVGRVVGIYPASGKAGITSWEMGGFVEESLRRAGELTDPLPPDLRDRFGLVSRAVAYHDIHLPAQLDDVSPARHRLVFDELLRLQLLLALRRAHVEKSQEGVAHPVDPNDLATAPGALVGDKSSLLRQFLAGHRFSLTGAQQRVLSDIIHDLGSPIPMHRLLQGDVGSGKTVVALSAMLCVIQGGRQAALMVPTEVLAEQHVAALRHDIANLRVRDDAVLGGERPVTVAFLTGRVKGSERTRLLEQLASGGIDIVVGTHALLGEELTFHSLGLVIVDEQHRFGVEQRAALRDAGRLRSLTPADPDVLVMTATPIPRTAAMVIFGDLDLSVLDERPQGRQPIHTTWLSDPATAHEAWARVREEVARGHRAYVVCPLVEGSDKTQATSAIDERTRLATHELKGLSVGLLHGQMKAAEKDDVMRQFRAGEIQVLVATVVIEVGIDVPDATVMVIEDAWRFGLAQLHQLRGRVGRGEDPSYCVLLGQPPSDEGARRLSALVATTDGFELAEVDLDLRGEGTLMGATQKGRSDLKLASLRDDRDTLERAHELARELASGSLSALPELIDELRLFVDEEEAHFLFSA